jgi:hypothetical protein
VSIRSRIERLEREFLPQERHGPITYPEFKFTLWCAQRSEAELKALPRGIRKEYEILFRAFKENVEKCKEDERLRLSNSKCQGPEAPKTSPKLTPSDSRSA